MKRIMTVILAAGVCGCHTFMSVKPDYEDVPADAVRAMAMQIESAILDGNREPGIADQDGVVVSGDDVKQAIRTRAARMELVTAFLETGHAAEGKNGLVTILRTAEYKRFGTSKDRNRTALMVMGENNDRWMIYEGILEASHFKPKSLPAIQAIFAEVRRELLATGMKYEDANGNIVVKGG